MLYPFYPDETTRPLVLGLMQMLWDRGEPDGYAERMTCNPLPDTPGHQVLMDVAFGDHQVTDYQADVEARTVGASAHRPVLYKGRWPNTNVLWNVPRISRHPFTGSAEYYWDIGPDPRKPARGRAEFIGVEPPPYQKRPQPPRRGPPRRPPGRAWNRGSSSYRTSSNGAIPKTDNCGGAALLRGRASRGRSGPRGGLGRPASSCLQSSPHADYGRVTVCISKVRPTRSW